jgi:hypothetical protein
MSVSSSSASYDSDAESDSFSSIQADFERLTEILQQFASDIDVLGSNLNKIQKPIENLELTQLAEPAFLETSPFRKQTFLVKASGCSLFTGIDKNKRYHFHEICGVLRSHLIRNNLVQSDGFIKLNEQLKKVFHIEEDSVQYLDIISHLRHVLV